MEYFSLVKGLTKSVSIATDEEDAIVNAIEEKTNLTPVGCVQHLQSNINPLNKYFGKQWRPS